MSLAPVTLARASAEPDTVDRVGHSSEPPSGAKVEAVVRPDSGGLDQRVLGPLVFLFDVVLGRVALIRPEHLLDTVPRFGLGRGGACGRRSRRAAGWRRRSGSRSGSEGAARGKAADCPKAELGAMAAPVKKTMARGKTRIDGVQVSGSRAGGHACCTPLGSFTPWGGPVRRKSWRKPWRRTARR